MMHSCLVYIIIYAYLVFLTLAYCHVAVFFMACNFLTIVAEAFQHENGKLEACILSRQQLQYAASDVYISGTCMRGGVTVLFNLVSLS
jgi:sensor domain CHASE-containing protein